MTPISHVILVDEQDHPIGTMEKIEAHQNGALHRAVSVVIFNSKGEVLIQQRALSKYHEPGKWSNTCCTHPQPNESTLDAAIRSLKNELGMQPYITIHDQFIYKSILDNNLTENEFDHIYVGITDIPPVPNPHEVMNYRYVSISELIHDMTLYQWKYTPWSMMIANKLFQSFYLIPSSERHTI